MLHPSPFLALIAETPKYIAMKRARDKTVPGCDVTSDINVTRDTAICWIKMQCLRTTDACHRQTDLH